MSLETRRGDLLTGCNGQYEEPKEVPTEEASWSA
jgi:hypothetical protein